MQQGDRLAINKHLSTFKQTGVVQFDRVLAIQSSERIPALTKTEDGRDEVLIAITAALKSAFGNFNLRVGLSEDQMVDLSDAIIDQSSEDNLSIEDILLFLQRLIFGQAGKVYDRMDIPTFFELFEGYRQERHEKMIQVRDEQHAQYRTLGRGDLPINPNKDANPQDIISLMGTLYSEDNDTGASAE